MDGSVDIFSFIFTFSLAAWLLLQTLYPLLFSSLSPSVRVAAPCGASAHFRSLDLDFKPFYVHVDGIIMTLSCSVVHTSHRRMRRWAPCLPFRKAREVCENSTNRRPTLPLSLPSPLQPNHSCPLLNRSLLPSVSSRHRRFSSSSPAATLCFSYSSTLLELFHHLATLSFPSRPSALVGSPYLTLATQAYLLAH